MSKDAVKFINFANANANYTKKNVKFMKGTRTKREIHEIRWTFQFHNICEGEPENARRRIQNHDSHEARKAKREISDAHTQHREIHISSRGKTWNSWVYPERWIDSRS